MNYINLKKKIYNYIYCNRPESATSKEWNEWRKQAKKNKIRWFITETFPFWFKSTFIWPIERFKDWIYYRTIGNYRKIKINSLKPGYYESRTLMLYGVFQLLEDFIEIEKAQMQYYFIEEDKMSWWKRKFSRFKRSRELGFKYLDWEITLVGEDKCPDQAEAAKEQKELYIWWKDIRPNRIDPIDIKGENGYSWSDYCRLIRQRYPEDFWHDEKTEEEEKISSSTLKISREYEEKYDKEDEEMLIRLIKIRQTLWT